jgi:MoaA/NifB/PqqE/SkfB family radical SAM enzyme
MAVREGKRARKSANMNQMDVLHAWKRILAGRKPLLSIELTRECPLRCPGCYAYEDGHLSDATPLRGLADLEGEALVKGVLRIVDERRPLHLSIVGGDPLVRYREVGQILPELARRGIYVQFVTSAFRPIPQTWSRLPRLKIVVSIDGLQPEHDRRRSPATYNRVLSHISGHRVTVHCTITAQMLNRSTYLQEFLDFWTPRNEIEAVWFSLFTPQQGSVADEILTSQQRRFVIRELTRLNDKYSKLEMSQGTISEFEHPPGSPEECIFARSTETISADLKTRIGPCQLGGKPDCSQCGCLASMALARVSHVRLGGIPLRGVFNISTAIGHSIARIMPGFHKGVSLIRLGAPIV